MGILINTGFDVGSSSPIDNRTLKDTIDERDALVSEGKVYENLKVYCKDTQKEYRWTGTDWEIVGSSSSGTGDIDLSDYYTKTEVDNDFLKKTDAASTYATKTELNEKANDDEVAKKADITDLQEQIDNLDIPENSDLTDINTKLAQLETKRVYNSLDELNTAKGLSISLTNGEDNTMKIVDALSPIETFADYFSNVITTNRFGIDTNTYGNDISLLIMTKFDDNVTIIRAYMSNGKLLTRRYYHGVLQDWYYDRTDLTATNTKISQLETQVNDLFQSVSNGKTLVANAITGKGVSTATDATFATMATNISKISASSYKEETKSYTITSSETTRFVFTFSANVIGVKQVIPPTYNSRIITQSSTKNTFTINGKELIFYVNGAGTWKVTAIIKA